MLWSKVIRYFFRLNITTQWTYYNTELKGFNQYLAASILCYLLKIAELLYRICCICCKLHQYHFSNWMNFFLTYWVYRKLCYSTGLYIFLYLDYNEQQISLHRETGLIHVTKGPTIIILYGNFQNVNYTNLQKPMLHRVIKSIATSLFLRWNCEMLPFISNTSFVNPNY